MASEGGRLLDRLGDSATVHRAFGTPIERDGCVVVPAARILGAGGGGEGTRGADGGEDSRAGSAEQGAGGGGLLRVVPVGVFVVRDGEVSWQPAVDVTRIVLGVQLLGLVVALVFRSIRRQRRG